MRTSDLWYPLGESVKCTFSLFFSRAKTKQRTIKGKRLHAAWDHDHLLKLLTG